MQHNHGDKLINIASVAWKLLQHLRFMKFLKIGEIKCKCDVLHLQKCCLQVHQFNSHTAELCRQQAQNTLRYAKQVLNSLPIHQLGNRLSIVCCPQ